ncbi:MAG: hypothetical protein ACM32J_06255 [Rhizobacter sp.]
MATYDLPASFKPVAASWGLQKAGAQFKSPFNGRTQAIDYVAERWVFSCTLAPQISYAAGQMDAFANLMAGAVNKVRAGHPTRLVPTGSMRGSPTVQTTTARGNATLSVLTTAGATLHMGDFIGCSGHLLQVAQDCTANGSGVLVVPLVNRIRGVIAAGTAVVWDRPKTTFVCRSMVNASTHMPGYMEGIPLDFEEDWS